MSLTGPNRAYPRARSIHALFERQAEAAPEAEAVVCGTHRLTYGELNARANALARSLQAHGIEPESRVIVCMDRCVEMVVAILAALKGGGAYVPLEPTYPAARLQYLVEDADAAVALTNVIHADTLRALTDVPVLEAGRRPR